MKPSAAPSDVRRGFGDEFLQTMLRPRPGPFANFVQRLEGLLSGGNPMFDLGIGLWSASGPSAAPQSFGQVLGAATQFASQRQADAMRNEALREQIEDLRRQRQAGSAVADLARSLAQPTEAAPLPGGVALPGADVSVPTMASGRISPELAQLITIMSNSGDVAGASELLAKSAGLLGADTRESASPIGKLYDDFEAAASAGNPVRAEGIRQVIAAELGKLGGEDEIGFDDVRATRNDLVRNSQSFLERKSSYDRVQIGAQSATPAGDVALVYGFMKGNDPGSVVREGEFATAENAAGVPERIRGLYNKLLTGERLTPEQRADFFAQATAQFQAAIKDQQRLIDDARKFAERNGLVVEDVVPEYLIPGELPSVAAPQRSVTLPGGVRVEFLD